MKPANNAPFYCAAMYPELSEIARANGYALAVHGSMARDFDLVFIPWAKEVSSVETVFDCIRKSFVGVYFTEPEKKNHGRTAYCVCFSWGNCVLDISFLEAKVAEA